LLVDDHALILEGICQILKRIPEVVVADAVTTGKEAVGLIAARDYDIYILDVGLPDTDCHYRNKDGNKIKGYSVNVTETCDQPGDDQEPALNLITNVQVEVVSTADSTYLEKAITDTQDIVPDKIEKIYADGAYNNPDNQDYCQNNDIDLLLTAMQGANPRYEVQLDENDTNTLKVTDTTTGETTEAQQVKTRKDHNQKKWKIKTEDGGYRYFDMESVRTSALRQKLRDIPIGERTRRNNVEATIFQLGYHYTNDKSRYRGLAKHKLWAYSRTLWINFVRILKYLTQLFQRTLFWLKSPTCFNKIYYYMQNITNNMMLKLLTNKFPKTIHFSAI
jgi:CheY-like chemotaxis protein